VGPHSTTAIEDPDAGLVAKTQAGDLPDAKIKFFHTGHFALETHAKQIGAAICTFLAKIRK